MLYSTDGQPVSVYTTDGTLVWGDSPQPELTEYRIISRGGVSAVNSAPGDTERTYTMNLPVWSRAKDVTLIWGDGRRMDTTTTLSAHVEYGGVTYPVTFGGQVSAPLVAAFSGRDRSPRHLLESDPLPIQARAGQTLTVRTTLAANPDGHPHQRAFGNVTGPLAVGGFTTGDTPAVLVIGDSISESGYAAYPPGTAITRALESRSVPFVHGGIWAITFPQGDGPDYNLPSAGVTHVLCETGFNDINMRWANGAGWEANCGVGAVRTWTAYAALGLSVWQTTTTPNTTGTWSTLEGQTPAPSTPDRIGWNRWLRDGAPLSDGVIVPTGTVAAVRVGDPGHPLAGVIELADTLESARDSGLWRVDHGPLTTDGTHPRETGHALMAAALEPWVASLSE